MRMQQARRRLPTLPQDRRVAAPVSAELRAWRVALVALGALFAGLSLARAAVMDSPARAYSIDGAKDIPLSAYVVGGDAVKRDKELRLTSDQQSQVGYVFTRDPLSSIGDEWRIDVSFRISGRGVTLFGDGMAFWYTRESFTPPAEGVRPAFGHAPSFTGLALFFDTYDNDADSHAHKHPYVSAMINDGTLEYQHDELTGVPMDSGHPDAGCHARIRQYGMDQKIVTARIEYNGHVGTLSVKLLFSRDRSWRNRPAYEWTNCLKMTDVHLPAGYYMGLSASTGDLSDIHDVISLEVYPQVAAGVADPPSEQQVLPSVGGADDVTPEPTRGVRAKPSQRGPPPAPRARAEREQGGSDGAELESAGAPAEAQETVVPVKRFEMAELSVNERKEIEDAISNTPAIRELAAEAAAIAATAEKLAEEVEQRLSGIYVGLDAALERIKDQEDAMEERISALEARIGGKMDSILEESRGNASGWVMPFLFLSVCLCGAGVFFVRGYRKIMKTHML